MSDKPTPDEMLVKWDNSNLDMWLAPHLAEALREAIRQRDFFQTVAFQAQQGRDEALAALRNWLAAYDSCGPDNGPSLTEHDCAECARELLNKSEGVEGQWDE